MMPIMRVVLSELRRWQRWREEATFVTNIKAESVDKFIGGGGDQGQPWNFSLSSGHNWKDVVATS